MLDHRIETFLTLYDEMNYRRTAERLNMTQPGVTQHIKYLEKYYGTPLFDYDGRALRRTEGAEILKRHIDCIVAEERAIAESLSKKKPQRLRLGATKTIGEFVICDRICDFLRDEGCELSLTVDNTDVLLSMLEASEIDFALIEGIFDKSRYGYHLMKKERFIGICAREHPFAGRCVTLEEAFACHVILRERGSGTRRIFEQALLDRGFSTESFVRCSEVSCFSVICDIVASTDAVTFGYAPVAASRGGLACFELRDVQMSGEFNFVYCNERIAREKIMRFFGEA